MIGISLGVGLQRASDGIDADAQAFFSRVTEAGGTLTTAEQNAVNQLVLDLKANSLWTPMKAIYPMVGSSAAACAQNLKSSSFTGTFTSGWTFASTGVKGNGSSTGFNTNYLVDSSNGFSMSNTHISHYSRTQVTGTYVDMGCGTQVPSYNYHNLFQEIGGNIGGSLGSITFSVSASNTIGFVIKGATSSANAKMYKNGSLIQTITTAQTNDNNINVNMYVGCQFYNGIVQQVSVRECAFASIGDGLTDTQASNFYTAVQAFQTTLNRYTDAPWYNNGNLLLDNYPSAAAAYSVRKLRNNYVGGPIRVRRSSDNAEQDIYFDANGNLDTAQLTSFCGAGNGFVTTWYDQSGNARNATQTTAANQPQIVSSGSVILNNGKLAIQNTSTTQILYLTRTNLGTQHSFFAVIDYTSTGKEFLGDFGSGSVSWAFYQTNGEYGAQSAAGQSGVALSLNQSLFELHRNGQTGIVNYQNGSQSGSTFSITSNNDFYLSNLGGESTVYNFIGYMQEAIIYPTIQFSNRSGIASNINSFYSIY